MIITYHGEGSFRLQSGSLSLLTNPLNNRLKADVVLKTLTLTEFISNSSFSEISFPGEYEIRGIEIFGWPVVEESTEKLVKSIYLVKWEKINFAFLGHIKEAPSMELLENLGDVNVLILPIGGAHFLEAGVAAKVAKQLEPNIIIPSFYKKTDDFLKAMGQKAAPQEKLVFKLKDIEEESNKVVILESG